MGNFRRFNFHSTSELKATFGKKKLKWFLKSWVQFLYCWNEQIIPKEGRWTLKEKEWTKEKKEENQWMRLPSILSKKPMTQFPPSIHDTSWRTAPETTSGCKARDSLGEHALAFLSFGRSPWHPYVLEVSHLSGCLPDFPFSWMQPKLGARSLSSQWEKEVGKCERGLREVGKCEGGLPGWECMVFTPFTTLKSSDDSAPPARLQQPALSLVRLASPVSCLANKWLAFRRSQY